MSQMVGTSVRQSYWWIVYCFASIPIIWSKKIPVPLACDCSLPVGSAPRNCTLLPGKPCLATFDNDKPNQTNTGLEFEFVPGVDQCKEDSLFVVEAWHLEDLHAGMSKGIITSYPSYLHYTSDSPAQNRRSWHLAATHGRKPKFIKDSGADLVCSRELQTSNGNMLTLSYNLTSIGDDSDEHLHAGERDVCVSLAVQEALGSCTEKNVHCDVDGLKLTRSYLSLLHSKMLAIPPTVARDQMGEEQNVVDPWHILLQAIPQGVAFSEPQNLVIEARCVDPNTPDLCPRATEDYAVCGDHGRCVKRDDVAKCDCEEGWGGYSCTTPTIWLNTPNHGTSRLNGAALFDPANIPVDSWVHMRLHLPEDTAIVTIEVANFPWKPLLFVVPAGAGDATDDVPSLWDKSTFADIGSPHSPYYYRQLSVGPLGPRTVEWIYISILRPSPAQVQVFGNKGPTLDIRWQNGTSWQQNLICPFSCSNNGKCVSGTDGASAISPMSHNVDAGCKCRSGWEGRVCEAPIAGPRFMQAMMYAIVLMLLIFLCPFLFFVLIRLCRQQEARMPRGLLQMSDIDPSRPPVPLHRVSSRKPLVPLTLLTYDPGVALADLTMDASRPLVVTHVEVATECEDEDDDGAADNSDLHCATSCDSSSEEVCSVCLIPYAKNDCLGRVPCGHTFHRSCIERWRRRRSTCPICRESSAVKPV